MKDIPLARKYLECGYREPGNCFYNIENAILWAFSQDKRPNSKYDGCFFRGVYPSIEDFYANDYFNPE